MTMPRTGRARVDAVAAGHWPSLYDLAYLRDLAAISDTELVAHPPGGGGGTAEKGYAHRVHDGGEKDTFLARAREALLSLRRS